MGTQFKFENHTEELRQQSKVKLTDLLSRINEEKKIDFKRAPHVGEDTVEVLKGLGYSDKKIAELKSNQSIHFPS